MPGLPLSLLEREEISVALTEDGSMSWAVIGRRVGRHPTTILREVTGSGGRHGYRPAVADRDARRRLARPRERLLAEPGLLRDRVTRELRIGRSPEAIWADLVAEEMVDVPCVETIYSSLYAGALTVKATECLRSRRPRRTEHCCTPGRCKRPHHGRPLGSRPDHREGQRVIDAVADRTSHSVLDPGHDARRVRRRRGTCRSR